MTARGYITLLLLFSSLGLLGNVAMPGFYASGAEGAFQLHFAQDSVYLEQIQMVSERVDIALYPGYAVVRGSYQFRNLSERPISLHTGYPIDAYTPNLHLGAKQNVHVQLGALHQFRVLVNGTPAPQMKPSPEQGNWHLWRTEFHADTITEVTVYFIINTNAASALKGYDKEYSNGLVYLLESGKHWAGVIEQGDFLIHLRDELREQDITGILPSEGWRFSPQKRVLLFTAKNFEPEPENNLVLRYGKRLKEFDLSRQALSRADDLYQELDELASLPVKSLTLLPFKPTRNLFDVSVFPGTRFYIWATLLGGIILGVLVIWGLWKLVFWIVRRR